MSKIYYFETLDECEKQIINKSIDLDMMFVANAELFDCFVRTFRTIIIWATIIGTGIANNIGGFKYSIKIFLLFILVYFIFKLLTSWVNFNYQRSYSKVKIDLVNNLIDKCKEWNEIKFEDWQKQQMLKRFASLANIQTKSK